MAVADIETPMPTFPISYLMFQRSAAALISRAKRGISYLLSLISAQRSGAIFHLPVPHAEDAVARLGQGFVVGDNDEGGAFAVPEFAEEGEEGFGVAGVEVAGGLVGEDHGGSVHEGAGGGDALLFTAGEGGGAVV
jgi:hypothetical protein